MQRNSKIHNPQNSGLKILSEIHPPSMRYSLLAAPDVHILEATRNVAVIDEGSGELVSAVIENPIHAR